MEGEVWTGNAQRQLCEGDCQGGLSLAEWAQILVLVHPNLAMATYSSSLKLSFSPVEKEMLKWHHGGL